MFWASLGNLEVASSLAARDLRNDQWAEEDPRVWWLPIQSPQIRAGIWEWGSSSRYLRIIPQLRAWTIPPRLTVREYGSEPSLSMPASAVQNARRGARTKRDATRPSIKSQSNKETDIISLTCQEVRYVRGDVSPGCPSRSWRLAGQLGNKLQVFEY